MVCTGDCTLAGVILPNPPKASNPLNAPGAPPITGLVTGGVLMLVDPKIDTRSSNGLLLVRTFAAAGLFAIAAPMPPSEGWPSIAGASSKSRRFSDCCPATTFFNAVWRAVSSSLNARSLGAYKPRPGGKREIRTLTHSSLQRPRPSSLCQ